MATTPNYGFVMPDSTDLVKDLPADFATFGNAVDGQMYTNANAAINKTLIDAKGDLIVGSAADTAARLAIGTDGYYLKANSGATNGVEWASISAGGMTLLSTTTLSGASTTISSISQSYKELVVEFYGVTNASAYYFTLDVNGSDTGIYATTTYFKTNDTYNNLALNNSRIRPDFANQLASSNSNNAWTIRFSNYASSSNYKPFIGYGLMTISNSSYLVYGSWAGVVGSNTAISSLTFGATSGSFSAGTIKIYGVS